MIEKTNLGQFDLETVNDDKTGEIISQYYRCKICNKKLDIPVGLCMVAIEHVMRCITKKLRGE